MNIIVDEDYYTAMSEDYKNQLLIIDDAIREALNAAAVKLAANSFGEKVHPALEQLRTTYFCVFNNKFSNLYEPVDIITKDFISQIKDKDKLEI